MPLPPPELDCPFCGSKVSLQDSKIIFKRSSYGPYFICNNFPHCDTYVSMQKNSPTPRPSGTPANKELRDLRREAHRVFDPIWEHREMTRQEAFARMAQILRIDPRRARIELLNASQCRRLIKAISLRHALSGETELPTASQAALPDFFHRVLEKHHEGMNPADMDPEEP